jgi:hypothetical protein
LEEAAALYDIVKVFWTEKQSWTGGALPGLLVRSSSGLLSGYQSIERREQRRALRVHTQAMYNNLWRMGASSEALLRTDDLNDAKRLAAGINEVSQAARNWVISLGKEYAEFAPYYEAAWEPKPLPPKSRLFWRRHRAESAE